MEPMMPPPPGGQPDRGPIELPGTGVPGGLAMPPRQIPGRLPAPPPPGLRATDAALAPAPEFLELLEATMRAAVMPDSVFNDLRNKETPDFYTMILNTLAWSGGGLLLGLVMTFLMLPSTAGLGIAPSLLVLIGGMVASVPMMFLAAGVLHGLSIPAGGQRGFAGSFEIISVMAALIPISMVIVFLPVPLIWLTPTVYATYLALRGVETLHRCTGMSAMATVGFFGIALVAIQFTSHKKIETFQQDLVLKATIQSTSSSSEAVEESNRAGTAAMPDPDRRMDFDQQWRTTSLRTPSAGALSGPIGSLEATGMSSPGPYMRDERSPRGGRAESGSLGFVKPSGSLAGSGQVENAYEQPPERPQPRATPRSGGPNSMVGQVLQMLNQQMKTNPDMMKNLDPDSQKKFQKILNKANDAATKAGGIKDTDASKMLNDLRLSPEPAPRKAVKKKRKKSSSRRRRQADPDSPEDESSSRYSQ